MESELVITVKHLRAARLVAEGKSPKRISDLIGEKQAVIQGWRDDPAFQAEVENFLAIERAAISSKGISTLEGQIKALEKRHGHLMAVIESRSVWDAVQTEPGGKTGYLARDFRGALPYFKVDIALLRELREIEKHLAILKRFWIERADLTSDGKPLQQEQPIINVYASESKSDQAADD